MKNLKEIFYSTLPILILIFAGAIYNISHVNQGLIAGKVFASNPPNFRISTPAHGFPTFPPLPTLPFEITPCDCDQKPTKTPTPTQEVTPTEIITPTPTEEVRQTPTPTPQEEVTPTPTPTPEEEITPTVTPTQTPTNTPKPTPTDDPDDDDDDDDEDDNDDDDKDDDNNDNDDSSDPEPAAAVGGIALGTQTFNPLLRGLQLSFGKVLGETTLPQTGIEDENEQRYPTGNKVISNSRIFIPKIAINQPLYQGQSIGNEILIGSGEILQMGDRNNRVIYAHNTSHEFGELYKLHNGDSILYTDEGRMDNYTVTHVARVSQYHTQVLEAQDANTITLMTCDRHDSTLRVIITATRQ